MPARWAGRTSWPTEGLPRAHTFQAMQSDRVEWGLGAQREHAGHAEAAQGLTSLLFALPVGWAADRGRKARIVAIGGGCIVVAAAATSFAVIYGVAEGGDDGFERTLSYGVFIGAMCYNRITESVPCVDQIPFYEHIAALIPDLAHMYRNGLSELPQSQPQTQPQPPQRFEALYPSLVTAEPSAKTQGRRST